MQVRIKVTVLMSIVLNILLIFSVFALDTPTVTVSPDTTNYYAEYTISSRIRNPWPLIQVEANVDSLVLIFNSSTQLPSTIDPAYVTVNGVASSGITVTNQRLSILTPVELRNFMGGTRDFTIVISEAAKIINPGTSGSYTLQAVVVQSSGSTIDGPATSSSYNIYTSTSTIAQPSVSPSPSIEGDAAAYTISFNVGKGGYLEAGTSTISVGFESSTVVPNGSISGVKINDISATAVGYNDTVVVTTPTDIENEGAVSLKFALGSGLYNPSPAGNYTLGVKTSSENTYVEADSFSIMAAGQFAISAININPATVNTVSEYSVDFSTGSSGALTANTDTITMIFPANTYLPGDISTSDIVLSSGGFSDNAYAAGVFNSNTNDADTLQFVPSIGVGNSSSASITISSSAGLLNPSEAGAYTISLGTSQESGLTQSNSYQVTSASTSVSQSIVTPTSSTRSADTSYDIDFNLGSQGRLQPGISTITLSFNSAYTLSTTLSDYDQSTISINSGTAVSIPTSNISPNNTTKTITVTIPSTVITSNSDNVVLFIGGTGGNQPITNPSTSDNYTLNVNTSVEETEVTSATYAIGGTAVTNTSISLSDPTVNNASQYTIGFRTTSTLTSLVDDYVKIIFPEGTVLPSSISTSNMTINGSNPVYVSVVPSTRTVTAAISQWIISARSTVTVIISSGANIVNPVVPSSSFYKATVSTSQDIVAVNTPVYTIYGDNTQASYGSASVSPSVRGVNNVSFTVSFSTSSTGKLQSNTSAGSSTITVEFDTVTVVPSSISGSEVKVNSYICQNATVLQSGNGGIVKVTLPASMTIDNSSTATVVFDSSAGLDTRDYSGTYNVRVKTSSDTVYSDTTGSAGDYTISDQQSFSFTSVTCNPAYQNANASLSIKFTLGSAGGLSAGDNVYLIFPSNTYIPSAISMSDIMVNGSSLTSNPQVSGDTVIISVPNTLSGLTAVTVLINQSAGILNPTLVQSYTMQTYTTAEAGPYTSPSYSITQTTSTVSVADVTVQTATPSSTSKYTIDFTVGSRGRLIGGSSTISVTFNSSTGVSGTASNYDSTYIIVDGSSNQIPVSNISISSREITFTVPSGVSIDNNDNVSIIINRSSTTKPITNPSTNGNYTLNVKTSVELTNVTSNQYTISSITAVTNITVDLSTAVVNASSTDTVSFRVQQALAAGSGTITITFPSNTLVPATMSTTNARVANGSNPTSFTDASAVVTNSATRTVTVTVPNLVSSTDSVRVLFRTAAGIENPSVYGNYTLNVNTSSQPLNGTSASYNLSSSTTSITNLTLLISPELPSVVAAYDFNFQTGSRGRLVSGESTISLLIAKDASFTLGAPQPSKVLVNETAADAVVLNTASDPNPDTLVVTVPSSVTIGNNTQVSVTIDATAGLQNASNTNSLTYGAFTSVEFSAQTTDYSLPVELTTFTANITNGRIVLNWTTESEIENAFWFIERRELQDHELDENKNPASVDLNPAFERIAQISGMGNKPSRTDYEFVDSTITNGKVYAYRLVDISYNGVTTYHEIVYIKVDLPIKFTLSQNYPNPFNPITSIKYTVPVEAKIKISVYNVLGQKIVDLVDDIHDTGNYLVKWNGLNEFNQRVASGFYVYRMQWKSLDGNQVNSTLRKMILMK